MYFTLHGPWIRTPSCLAMIMAIDRCCAVAFALARQWPLACACSDLSGSGSMIVARCIPSHYPFVLLSHFNLGQKFYIKPCKFIDKKHLNHLCPYCLYVYTFIVLGVLKRFSGGYYPYWVYLGTKGQKVGCLPNLPCLLALHT